MIIPRTNTPTVIPGLVTEEKQLIVDRISWDISAWYATAKQLAEETKPAKEQIEKMRNKLKKFKETRDLTDGSVEYTIDRILCDNGVDRKVYHGQCLIGPQIQKLLANQVKIMDQLEEKCLRVREENLKEDPKTNLASPQEIKEEMISSEASSTTMTVPLGS
jgi:hypothetical protein